MTVLHLHRVSVLQINICHSFIWAFMDFLNSFMLAWLLTDWALFHLLLEMWSSLDFLL